LLAAKKSRMYAPLPFTKQLLSLYDFAFLLQLTDHRPSNDGTGFALKATRKTWGTTPGGKRGILGALRKGLAKSAEQSNR